MSVDEFLAMAALAETTKANYARYLGYLQDWLGDKSISEITPELFRRFLASKNWGGCSKWHAFTALRSYIRFAFGEGHPFMAYRMKREKPAPGRVLTIEEVRRLVKSIDTRKATGARNLVIVLLMLDSGLRASEVCSLEIGHLNLPERSLYVQTKGGGWKLKVFSDLTAAYLEGWLVERQAYARHGVKTVFVSIGGTRPGEPLTRHGLKDIFCQLGKKAGIPGLTPHVMRRTFATLSMKRGAPSRLVQVAGGWSRIEMVERYTPTITAEDMRAYFATGVLG